MAPAASPLSLTRRTALPILVVLGVAWLVQSVVSPSASLPYVWPWSLVSALGWGAVAIVGAVGWWRGARLGPLLDSGLWLLAGASVVSAALSDAPGVAGPAAWSVAALCLAPFAWLWLCTVVGREGVRRSLAVAAGVILVASLFAWWPQVAARADTGVGWPQALSLRNDQPFGHSTYTAAFALLAISALATAGVAASPGGKGLAVLGSAAGVAVLVGSGSRAGLLAAGVGALAAGAVALPLLGAMSRRLRGGIIVGVLLLLALGVAANPRLRARVLEGRWTPEARESNAQRAAMAQAAVLLGRERPWLGWGPGMVPHVFPSVRARVGGTVDNVLQVHQSPLQAWVTLGGLGVAGALLVFFGACARAFAAVRSAAPRAETAALTGGLAAGATFFLFDHSLDVPAIGLLATGLLALLGEGRASGDQRSLRWGPPLLVGAALLALTLPHVIRDQIARRHHAASLDAVAAGDPARFLTEIRSASRALPDAPYLLHVEAGYLATGLPFAARAPSAAVAPPAGGPARAEQLLQASLTKNPFLEYAEYNLGWLRLAASPVDAERHFAAAARLAPHRVGVYLGLGLARAAQGNAAGAITAFAVERINAPVEAFSPLFRDAIFATLTPDIDAQARTRLAEGKANGRLSADTVAGILDVWSSVAAAEVAFGSAYHRIRPGYGLLMGFPAGRPPADVFALHPVLLLEPARSRLPAAGWVRGDTLLEWAGIPPEAPR
jgi:hypothetical protein